MQTRMGTSSPVTRSKAPDMQGNWELQRDMRDLDSSRWYSEGEPMMTEDTAACKPYRGKETK
jgi:hypothetical protein